MVLEYFKNYFLEKSNSYQYYKMKCNEYEKRIDEFQRVFNSLGLIKEELSKLNTYNHEEFESLNFRMNSIDEIKGEITKRNTYNPDDYVVIKNSGLFDERWYLEKYPYVLYKNIDPITHHLITWNELSTDPSPLFSTVSYLNYHEDVKESGMNPFVHYIKYGKEEDRRIFPSGFIYNVDEKSNKLDQIILQENVRTIQEKIKRGFKINVVFITYKNIWTNDILYEMLNADENFNVNIIVVPYMPNLPNVSEINSYLDIYNKFKQEGYNVIKGYDEETEQSIDIELECSPDIIFYSSNWMNIYPTELQFDFIPRNALLCYIPYGISTGSIFEQHVNSKMYEKSWKVFCESNYHKKTIIQNNNLDLDPGKFIFTGFPKLDGLFLKKYYNETWKWERTPSSKSGKYKKRIIWSPHWTFDKNIISFSTFDKNYNFFYNYAKSNNNVEWIFRPHPLLKESIVSNNIMTKKQVETYYENWNNLDNSRIYEGKDYVALYKYSDAMITDSVSFIAEYLFCNKPGLRLTKDTQDFNSFGKKAAEMWYDCKGSQLDYIEDFIENIVLNENDFKKDKRTEFLEKNLIPKGNKTASENIFNYLKNTFITKKK